MNKLRMFFAIVLLIFGAFLLREAMTGEKWLSYICGLGSLILATILYLETKDKKRQ